jgi:hypothetical protein
MVRWLRLLRGSTDETTTRLGGRRRRDAERMAIQFKCPSDLCPPTDFAPADATSFADGVPMSVCGGRCSVTYATAAFKILRTK